MRWRFIIIIAAAWIAAGCTRNVNPLDNTPPPPQQNTFSVTVFTAATPYPGASVYCISPNGSADAAITDSNGVATFSKSGTGVYHIGLSGQQAQNKVDYAVTVNSGQAIYSLSLQLQGAALALSSPVGQGNGYQWQSSVKTYAVTYLNSSDNANDITVDLDPAFPVPVSWTASMSPTYLRKGDTSILTLVIPQGIQSGTVTLRVRGRKQDGTVLLNADIVLTQDWYFRVRRIYRFDQGSGYCTGFQTYFTALTITAETVGVPSGALVEFVPGVIAADGCNICGAAYYDSAPWSGISTVFYPGIINGLVLTNPGGYLSRYYRTGGAGACTGYQHWWSIPMTVKLGGTAKTVTDTIYVNLNGAFPQAFTFFN